MKTNKNILERQILILIILNHKLVKIEYKHKKLVFLF